MEAASGKRRGRPRRFTKVSAEMLDRAVTGRMVGTVRGRQDRLYAAMAELRLREVKPEAWVLGSGRQGLLTQLGRLLADERVSAAHRARAFIIVVAWLEEQRPKTKDGERIIRRRREGLRSTSS